MVTKWVIVYRESRRPLDNRFAIGLNRPSHPTLPVVFEDEEEAQELVDIVNQTYYAGMKALCLMKLVDWMKEK